MKPLLKSLIYVARIRGTTASRDSAGITGASFNNRVLYDMVTKFTIRSGKSLQAI